MDKFLIDSHKLMYHPDRVADLIDAKRDWSKHKKLRPIYAEISSSGACNHRCTFCSVDYIGYKKVFLDRQVLLRFFESSSKIGLKAVMFAGDGEPLLNPEIIDIVNDARLFNIDTSFTTNGVYITENFIEQALEKVSWIKVSLNAGDQDTYEKIHRTNKNDFNRVWTNLSKAVKAKDDSKGKIKTALGVQSLILPDNIKSLDELAKRSRDTGLNYIVLKPYVHNVYMKQEGYNDIDYTEKQYKNTLAELRSKYETSDFTVVARDNALAKLVGEQERYTTCWSTPALWFYISGDGSVYGCGAHVGNPNFLLGNIKESPMSDIWESKSRQKCLDYVQDDLDLSSCRRTCRMDEVNAYLSRLINNETDHVNFI